MVVLTESTAPRCASRIRRRMKPDSAGSPPAGRVTAATPAAAGRPHGPGATPAHGARCRGLSGQRVGARHHALAAAPDASVVLVDREFVEVGCGMVPLSPRSIGLPARHARRQSPPSRRSLHASPARARRCDGGRRAGRFGARCDAGRQGRCRRRRTQAGGRGRRSAGGAGAVRTEGGGALPLREARRVRRTSRAAKRRLRIVHEAGDVADDLAGDAPHQVLRTRRTAAGREVVVQPWVEDEPIVRAVREPLSQDVEVPARDHLVVATALQDEDRLRQCIWTLIPLPPLPPSPPSLPPLFLSPLVRTPLLFGCAARWWTYRLWRRVWT